MEVSLVRNSEKHGGVSELGMEYIYHQRYWHISFHGPPRMGSVETKPRHLAYSVG